MDFLFDKNSRNDFYQHSSRNRTSSNLSRESSQRKFISRNSSSPILSVKSHRNDDSVSYLQTKQKQENQIISEQPTPDLDEASDQPRVAKIVKFEVLVNPEIENESKSVSHSSIELVRSPSKKSNIKSTK